VNLAFKVSIILTFLLQNATLYELRKKVKSQKIIQIKELQSLLKIDWSKVINDQLMKDFQISGNDFVLVENFETMLKRGELLMTTNKS
jgi:hypothetical protein